jgi:hypothetical protein
MTEWVEGGDLAIQFWHFGMAGSDDLALKMSWECAASVCDLSLALGGKKTHVSSHIPWSGWSALTLFAHSSLIQCRRSSTWVTICTAGGEFSHHWVTMPINEWCWWGLNGRNSYPPQRIGDRQIDFIFKNPLGLFCKSNHEVFWVYLVTSGASKSCVNNSPSARIHKNYYKIWKPSTPFKHSHKHHTTHTHQHNYTNTNSSH